MECWYLCVMQTAEACPSNVIMAVSGPLVQEKTPLVLDWNALGVPKQSTQVPVGPVPETVAALGYNVLSEVGH